MPRSPSRTDPQLNTRARRRACAEIRRSRPWICAICLLPIPRDVDPQRSRLAHTVDEIRPRSHGGSATDPANLQPAHLLCNSTRSNGPLTEDLTRRCRQAVLALTTANTSRNW